MDGVSRAAVMANTEVLKEPRGFIKFVEIFIVIFAFATATSFNSQTTYSVQCPNNTTFSHSLKFQYPFRLDETKIVFTQACGGNSSTTDAHLYGSYSSASEFFVFVGVTAFLYCLGMTVFYVFGDDKYHNIEMIPVVDFIVTAVYAALWLISSSAWADALTKIKKYTDPTYYYQPNYICECAKDALGDCVKASACPVTDGGNFATGNVSVVFGFLCLCVFLGNLWFLYKETKWFKSSSMPPSMPQQSTPNMQQQI